MKCDELRALLPAYADGDLEDAQERQVERHLMGCAGCEASLARLRRADAVVLGWAAAPAPMQLRRARIDAAVLGEVRRRRGLSPRLSRALGNAGLATVALVMALGVFGVARMLSGRQPSDLGSAASGVCATGLITKQEALAAAVQVARGDDPIGGNERVPGSARAGLMTHGEAGRRMARAGIAGIAERPSNDPVWLVTLPASTVAEAGKRIPPGGDVRVIGIDATKAGRTWGTSTGVATARRLDLRDQAAGCELTVAGLRPALILVNDMGERTRLKPGSERFADVAPGLDKVLRRVNARVARWDGYDEEAQLRMEDDEESVEVVFPEPGVRLGGHGPYTRVIVPLSIPGSVYTDGTDLWILLGTERYSHKAAADAEVELDGLRKRLGMEAVHDAEVVRAFAKNPAEAEIVGVVRLFDMAATNFAMNAGMQYDAEARAYLSPEYAAQVDDLDDLGVPASIGTRSRTASSHIVDLRIMGDRATLTSVSDVHTAGTWTQRFELERRGGVWWISGVDRAEVTRFEAISPEQHRRKVSTVAAMFWLNAGSALLRQSTERDAAVRERLIPGYDSWEADLKGVLGEQALAADVSSWGGGTAGETVLDGKTAVYTTELRFGSARPRVRFALTYTEAGWKIRGVERAP